MHRLKVLTVLCLGVLASCTPASMDDPPPVAPQARKSALATIGTVTVPVLLGG